MNELLAGEAMRAAREWRDASQEAGSAWSAIERVVCDHPPGEDCGLDAAAYSELLRALNAYGDAFASLGRTTESAVKAAMRLGGH
jgi:hypothetical protein